MSTTLSPPISLSLQLNEDRNAYAFVTYGVPVICIAKNFRVWAEDEMRFCPDDFVLRVSGVLSHESLHVVLDELLDDGFNASAKLDNFFGKIQSWDLATHGLWDLEESLRLYGNATFSSEGQ